MSISTSRRGLLTASAWAVPTVVVASAAPAFAASRCVDDVVHTVVWAGSAAYPYSFAPAAAGTASLYQSGTGTIQAIPATNGLTQAQIQAVSPLTVTLQNSVPTTGSSNRMRGLATTYDGRAIQNMRVTSFNASGFGHRGLALAQQATGNGNLSGTLSNHVQTLTMNFSRPVKELSFRIGDIDASNGNHSDRVSVAPQAATIVRGSVRGNGTGTTDGANNTAGHLVGPFRPSANGIVNDATGTTGNVTMTYGSTTSISSITLRFWNNDSSGGMQWIFLSNLSFKASTC